MTKTKIFFDCNGQNPFRASKKSNILLIFPILENLTQIYVTQSKWSPPDFGNLRFECKKWKAFQAHRIRITKRALAVV